VIPCRCRLHEVCFGGNTAVAIGDIVSTLLFCFRRPCFFALLAVFLSFFAGCGARDVVVVYSPHGADVLGDYEKLFEAAYPGVDMQWLDMGAQEVYARVSAERNRPAGDVWWGAPSTFFLQAAQEGLLAPYRPSWADAIDPVQKDAEDRWYATYLSPLAIMFNSRALTRETAPQTWDALLEEQWKGRITLRKPQPSGTMRTFLAAMIARAPDEDAGIAWLKRLHAATESYPENPTLLYDHMKKQEELVSVWLQPDIVMQRERNGYPFDYHLPPDTPVLAEGIAIIKNAPHPEWAKKFYDFVTMPEALAHQANAYAKWPARKDLDPATLPDWMTRERVQAMKLDPALLAANTKAWCDRWEKEVYAAP